MFIVRHFDKVDLRHGWHDPNALKDPTQAEQGKLSIWHPDDKPAEEKRDAEEEESEPTSKLVGDHADD